MYSGKNIKRKKIIVVGGGPAGIMAAISARMNHGDVTLVEKNAALGRKLLLTGNGRCNLTNACDMNLFSDYFFQGGKFLRDAFKECTNNDVIKFFKSRGVSCKIEENNCVFPASDSAVSILDVFKRELERREVSILYNASAKKIEIKNGIVQGIILNNGRVLSCDSVIMATGGISYPHTGSDGAGFKIASEAGHTIAALRPGIVPLEVEQNHIQYLEGLTLKNTALTFKSGNKKRISKIGDLLFTHRGISGPLVLSHSSAVVQWLVNQKKVQVLIDFSPNWTKEEMTALLLKEWTTNPKKTIKNSLSKLIPLRLSEILIRIHGIDGNKTVSYVTKAERRVIVDFLKETKLDIAKPSSIEKAMITQGGVSLKEIYPHTMESRVIKGLYFAGEMLDIAADTGGFNLQAAFSTGWCAGKNAAL